MKYFNCTEEPIQIYGLAHKGEDGRFWRLHESVVDNVSEVIKFLGRRCTGGRIRFATDSKKISINMKLLTLGVDINFSIGGSAGADVYIGKADTSRFIDRVFPHDYKENCKDITTVIDNSFGFQTFTVNLPRNEYISELIIGIDDDARIEKPEKYTYSKPVVFYGSSITEGCSAERPGCAYTSMVARWLDCDYWNFGFSGSAKGEPTMADYILGLDISALVYDYDHNAPNTEHLENTHEAFFKRIREGKPDLPVIMMSRPDFYPNSEESAKRREIIKRTYENAIKRGDKKVWFIDGETLYGDWHFEDFTIDNCHPNGAGFMAMANKVYPILKEALDGKDNK